MGYKKENIITIKRPDVLEKWDYEKNDKLNLKPDKLTINSIKSVWWKCDRGHSYQRAIVTQIYQSSKCPHCRAELVADNEILNKMFDKEKNKVRPEDVHLHSKKSYWWKCEEGHRFECKVYLMYRRPQKCLICRKDFLTNYPILAEEYDKELNEIPLEKVTMGMDKKFHWKCKNGHTWQNRLRSNLPNKSRCLICQREATLLRKAEEKENQRKKREEEQKRNAVNKIKKEKKLKEEKIRYVTIEHYQAKRGQEKKLKEEESLAYMYPVIAQYWHTEKNGDKSPYDVSGIVEGTEYWWKCENGHEWVAPLMYLLKAKTEPCTICGGRISEYTII